MLLSLRRSSSLRAGQHARRPPELSLVACRGGRGPHCAPILRPIGLSRNSRNPCRFRDRPFGSNFVAYIMSGPGYLCICDRACCFVLSFSSCLSLLAVCCICFVLFVFGAPLSGRAVGLAYSYLFILLVGISAHGSSVCSSPNSSVLDRD